MLIAVGGHSRLVLTDATGACRLATSPRSRAVGTSGCAMRRAWSSTPGRLVAYVLGARPGGRDRPADHARPPAPPALRPRLFTIRGCRACGADLTAVWLGDARLAVAGFRLHPSGPIRRRVRPAGAAVIDTRSWTARPIAPRGGAVVRAGDDLLVFDGRHPAGGPCRGSGLRVHGRAGRLRYTTLRGEHVGDDPGRGRAGARARQERSLRRRPPPRARDRPLPAPAARRAAAVAALRAYLATLGSHATFPSRLSSGRRDLSSWKPPLYTTQPASPACTGARRCCACSPTSA
jgi:hypothetical protein